MVKSDFDIENGILERAITLWLFKKKEMICADCFEKCKIRKLFWFEMKYRWTKQDETVFLKPFFKTIVTSWAQLQFIIIPNRDHDKSAKKVKSVNSAKSAKNAKSVKSAKRSKSTVLQTKADYSRPKHSDIRGDTSISDDFIAINDVCVLAGPWPKSNPVLSKCVSLLVSIQRPWSL